jgi:hypothetical protein
MRRLISWLMTIGSPDGDIQRCGRVLVVLTLGLIALSLQLLPTTTTAENPLAALLVVGLSFVCYAIILVLARYGHVTAGGLLIIALTALGTLHHRRAAGGQPGRPRAGRRSSGRAAAGSRGRAGRRAP